MRVGIRPVAILILAVATALFGVPSAFAQSDAEARETRNTRNKETRRLLKEATECTEAGKFDRALIGLDSVLVLDSANPDAYYYKAVALAQSGDSTTAIDILRVGSEKAPLSSRIKLLLAEMLLSRQNIDEASPLVDAVLAIKPREGEALYLKGVIQMERGDTAAALDTFQRALEIALLRGGK